MEFMDISITTHSLLSYLLVMRMVFDYQVDSTKGVHLTVSELIIRTSITEILCSLSKDSFEC